MTELPELPPLPEPPCLICAANHYCPTHNPATSLDCWGLSSFCAEVGHKCRAAGTCVYTPPPVSSGGPDASR